MYFPYFRGRQYELLALRELAQGGLLGKHVIPVVEPIKITSTFNGTVKQFAESELPLSLVVNPAVGELSGTPAIDEILEYATRSIIPAVIMGKDTAEAIAALSVNDVQKNSLLAIMTNSDFLEAYQESFRASLPKFTLFPGERRLQRAIKKNKVLFEDRYNKLEKNAAYLKQDDEFYSDDHLYFKEEGFVGFGDYSIVGSEYVESGFAPYAVAIHIVYLADDNALRIRHFVSDSNTDITDVAGKYYEAVSKLKKWYDAGQARQLTTGLSILLSHAESEYYPGLPTIKKLSIMHHLELMGKHLDGGARK